MEKQDGTDMYSNLLDAFGSDVGSTLDDLATDWEQYDSRQSESGQNMEDLGKRMAKPLFFFNPVYSMVNNNKEVPVIRRPTLIPLAELNKNNKDELRERADSKSHEKKKHGLLSKIAGLGRRHSKDKLEPYRRPSTEVKLSEESIVEDISSFAPVESYSKRSTPLSNSPLTVTPEKPARHSLTSNLVNNGDEPEVAKPVPTPRKNKPSPVMPRKEEEEKAKETIAELKNVDSGSSFSSTHSDEGNMSDDGVITTMADVINEVSTAEKENNCAEANPTENTDINGLDEANHNTGEVSLLKRNKTIKWSGSRKAPALIREFTRRQKTRHLTSDSSNLGSPNKEVESALLSNSIMQESPRPRSCTPSQQTTSFGMDASDPTSTADENTEAKGEAAQTETVTGRLIPEPTHAEDTLKSPTGSGNKRDSAFIVLSSLLPPAPRLRRTQSSKVRAYLYKMGTNSNNALGYAVGQFIQQTLKNKETRPLVLLHDIRSFLTDIKRYLISNPHIGVVKKIQKIVNNNSSVDVEGAVDDSLDKLVLYPLHSAVYRCLVIDYTKIGQLKLLEEAIHLAKTKTNQELGLRPTLIPPNEEHLEVIKGHFVQLQKTYSPYYKLKELLQAVTVIYENTQDMNVDDHSAKKIGADDFLPLLVHSVVHCNFVAADIEAQYIDGLLDPTLLLGEGGYYLTTLISAVQVVFSMKRREAALPNISDLQGFLKVGISSVRRKRNSLNSTASPKQDVTATEDFILHKTLHVPPAMTAHSLCQMITRKFNIGSPEDYCLHVIVNNNAHPLEPNECPQLVKMDLLTQFPASDFYFSFQKKSLPNTNKLRPISIIQQEGVLIATSTVVEDVEGIVVPVPEKEDKADKPTDDNKQTEHKEPQDTQNMTDTNGDMEKSTNVDKEPEAVQTVKDDITTDPEEIPLTNDTDNDCLQKSEDETASPQKLQLDKENDHISDKEVMASQAIEEKETDHSPLEEKIVTTKVEEIQATTKDESKEQESITSNHKDDAVETVTQQVCSTDEQVTRNNAPEISVTSFAEAHMDAYILSNTQLGHTSHSGSMDDVFSQSLAAELSHPHRETVASLTEYFESRSTSASPKYSPK